MDYRCDDGVEIVELPLRNAGYILIYTISLLMKLQKNVLAELTTLNPILFSEFILFVILLFASPLQPFIRIRNGTRNLSQSNTADFYCLFVVFFLSPRRRSMCSSGVPTSNRRMPHVNRGRLRYHGRKLSCCLLVPDSLIRKKVLR